IAWDAWDIDPSYEERWERVTGPQTTARIVETGPLRVSVLFETVWRDSKITQYVRLCAHSARLDFVTDVDWHEQQTLLKAAFPTAVAATEAIYDVQWGRVARSTTRDTSFDAARFEVPAHKWASVADDGIAVAVLNDCKYGYDVLGGRIRITLIKSSSAPDPHADQGMHSFTYAYLPYAPAMPQVLDHAAYDLNVPLRHIGGGSVSMSDGKGVVAVRADNVIVETLKAAADGRGMILRVFEAHGTATNAELLFCCNLGRAEKVSIFEQAIDVIPIDQNRITLALKPFQIERVRMVFAAD
ncbi:MAG: glycoside hydrolase family 38 C-terminal domain-containing protein, partial [Pseudomonadota bacterium]